MTILQVVTGDSTLRHVRELIFEYTEVYFVLYYSRYKIYPKQYQVYDKTLASGSYEITALMLALSKTCKRS